MLVYSEPWYGLQFLTRQTCLFGKSCGVTRQAADYKCFFLAFLGQHLDNSFWASFSAYVLEIQFLSWQWEVNLASLETPHFGPQAKQDFCSESSAAGMSLSFGSPCQSLAGPSDQIILWRGIHAFCMCKEQTILVLLHTATQQSQSHEAGIATTRVLPVFLPYWCGHSQEASHQHVLGKHQPFLLLLGLCLTLTWNRFAACLCLVTYIKLCLGQLLP